MATKRNRQRTQLLITAGVMGVILLIVAGVAISLSASGDPRAKPQQAGPQQTGPQQAGQGNPADSPRPAANPVARADEPASTGPTLVDDDGRTLWAAPTAGNPLPLEGLPLGTQAVLSIRPVAILETDDGRIALEHFRGTLTPVLKSINGATGLKLSDISRLAVAVRPGATSREVEVAVVVEADADKIEPTTGAAKIIAPAGPWPVARLASGQFVAAKRAVLDEILENAGVAPPLRREMEQLVAQSDRERHVSLLVAPSFLFADGKAMFTGDIKALRGPLFEQLPDELRGLLVSAHWLQDSFYWELRGASAAEMTPTRLIGTLGGRMDRWPGELQLAVLDLNPAPHGRRVVANLPAMMRVLKQYARRGVVGRQAVFNGYLPPAAGHNLLLAADLMLAQQSAGAGGVAIASSAPPTGTTPQTAAQRLQQPATVSFDRDTLEMSVKYLSDEINVPIVILGGDLQLDGITKNQSFGLDQQNKPGEEVLIEILRRSNPDKTATGPADPKQKLVYVIRPDDAGQETIYITTRAATTKRGEKLPAVFAP